MMHIGNSKGQQWQKGKEDDENGKQDAKKVILVSFHSLPACMCGIHDSVHISFDSNIQIRTSLLLVHLNYLAI